MAPSTPNSSKKDSKKRDLLVDSDEDEAPEPEVQRKNNMYVHESCGCAFCCGWHGNGNPQALLMAGVGKRGMGLCIGGVLVRWARAGHLFLTILHPCLFLPPPHQTIWSTFSPCLRIWPILCTQFTTMARVVVGSGGGDILCC